MFPSFSLLKKSRHKIKEDDLIHLIEINMQKHKNKHTNTRYIIKKQKQTHTFDVVSLSLNYLFKKNAIQWELRK